jgi:hypothetical protein
MTRVRLAAVLLAAASAILTLTLAGSAHWHSSKRVAAPPLQYMPIPGGDAGEGLSQMDSYWSDRLTYPTGNFNAAWLRHAAEQADKIPSGIPAGRRQASGRSARSATAERELARD